MLFSGLGVYLSLVRMSQTDVTLSVRHVYLALYIPKRNSCLITPLSKSFLKLSSEVDIRYSPILSSRHLEVESSQITTPGEITFPYR